MTPTCCRSCSLRLLFTCLLSFNLLAGINPPLNSLKFYLLPLWQGWCCHRSCQHTGSCTSAHPQASKCHICFTETVGTLHSSDSSACPPCSPQGSVPLFCRVGISKGWQGPAPTGTLSNRMPSTIQYWEGAQGSFAQSYRVKGLPWSSDAQFLFQFRGASGPALSAVT